jgi:hypothetical protein
MKSRDLPTRILGFLAKHPFAERRTMASQLDVPASTLNFHVSRLIEQGKIRDGLCANIDKFLFRKFIILINTRPPTGAARRHAGRRGADKERAPNYQLNLIDDIREEIDRDDELLLESVDIVMGADWDIILMVRADDLGPVADFVVRFLRVNECVAGTRTTFVWWDAADQPPPGDG